MFPYTWSKDQISFAIYASCDLNNEMFSEKEKNQNFCPLQVFPLGGNSKIFLPLT